MFGGETISLILPKLIRSVVRDGIWIFNLAGKIPGHFNSTTQGKTAAFNGVPA
jgi:hypothetical protein